MPTTAATGPSKHARVTAEGLDLRERGAPVDGAPQIIDRRLLMQLHVFGGCHDPSTIRDALEASPLEGVLYLDVNDPFGIGILLMTEDPEVFVGPARALLTRAPFGALTRKPELTMIGRTYASGREPDLAHWLLVKPRRNALNPDWPWAVWYPLRRKPEFELLPSQDQAKILAEHAMLGRAYGEAGHAADIRLACHGLDQRDNEFVLGLVGPELVPLSKLIQDMRRTQQTAKYIQSMGPFFVGRVLWQRALSRE